MYKSLLLASAAVVSAAFSAQALVVSYYAGESRLASGHWVKIEADTTGIYQITPDELA